MKIAIENQNPTDQGKIRELLRNMTLQSETSLNELLLGLKNESKNATYEDFDIMTNYIVTHNELSDELKDQICKRLLINYCVYNRYNPGFKIPQSLIPNKINIDELLYAVDTEHLLSAVKSLSEYDTTFAPLSYTLIMGYLDDYFRTRRFISVTNILFTEFKSIKKNGKVIENTSSFFNREHDKIIKYMQRSKVPAKTIAQLNEFRSWFPNEETFNNRKTDFINNRIERYMIPQLLENCFLNIGKIELYKQITIIFPLIYLLSPDIIRKVEIEQDSMLDIKKRFYLKIWRVMKVNAMSGKRKPHYGD